MIFPFRAERACRSRLGRKYYIEIEAGKTPITDLMSPIGTSRTFRDVRSVVAIA